MADRDFDWYKRTANRLADENERLRKELDEERRERIHWEAEHAGAFRAEEILTRALDKILTQRIELDRFRDARKWHPDDGDKRCQRCGQENVVWFADSHLWNYVNPAYNILCPSCFIEIADATDMEAVSWRLQPRLRTEQP